MMGQLRLDFFRQVAEEGINHVNLAIFIKSCLLFVLMVALSIGKPIAWCFHSWRNNSSTIHVTSEVLTSSLSACSDRVVAVEASTFGNALRSRY